MRLLHSLPLLILLAGRLLAPSNVYAQEEVDHEDLNAYFIDFAIPDLAAFTLLGVDGARVSRPGNVRELSVALQNGLGERGVLEQGLGLEVAPVWLADAPDVIGDYRPLVHRLTVSAATLKSSDTTRLGLSFRWVPIDRSDPYASPALRDAIRTALVDALTGSVPSDVRVALTRRVFEHLVDDLDAPRPFDIARLLDLDDLDSTSKPVTISATQAHIREELAAQEIELTAAQADTLLQLARDYVRLANVMLTVDAEATARQAVTRRREEFRDTTWNAFALQFAGGITALVPGALGEAEAEALSAFAGLSYPLINRYGQLVVHGQLRVPIDDDDLQASVGGRLLLGTATRRLSLEGLWAVNDERLGGDTDNVRLTVGAELRLASGTYLELATGVNLPERGEAGLLTLGALKYALRSDRRFYDS